MLGLRGKEIGVCMAEMKVWLATTKNWTQVAENESKKEEMIGHLRHVMNNKTK